MENTKRIDVVGAYPNVSGRMQPIGGFWLKRTDTPDPLNGGGWVGSRLGSDGGADSGFAPFAKIPTVRRPTAYRYISPDGEHRTSARRALEMQGARQTIVGKPGLPIVWTDAPIGIGHM